MGVSNISFKLYSLEKMLPPSAFCKKHSFFSPANYLTIVCYIYFMTGFPALSSLQNSKSDVVSPQSAGHNWHTEMSNKYFFDQINLVRKTS